MLAAVRTHRIAGVIFADFPTRLFQEPGLCHAALTFTGEYLGAPAVGLEAVEWQGLAVTVAVAAGRSRVACLATNPLDSIWGQAYRAELERHGLEYRP